MGLEVFKTLAKNKSPAIAKDLNTFFSKYDSKTSGSSMISRGPPKQPTIPSRRGSRIVSQKSLTKSNKTPNHSDLDL